MTEQQMPKMMGALVEFQGGFRDLSEEEGQWVIQKTADAVAVMRAAVEKAYAEINQLLHFLGTVTILATTTKFIARDKFVVNTDDDASVKISGFWGSFREWFLDKVEDPIAEQTLRYAKLRKASVDGPIVDELGGKEKAETTLAEIYDLMAKQGKGQKGVLLTNGYANIFYVKDVNGVLRAVSVHWYDGGWLLYASALERPFGWLAGSQAFSRSN